MSGIIYFVPMMAAIMYSCCAVPDCTLRSAAVGFAAATLPLMTF